MKKTLVLLVVMVLLMFGAKSLLAHDDDRSPDQKLTGEVVCLSCYLGHGAMGDIHAKCAKQCFAKGLPVGLKVGDQLYLLVGEKHGAVNKGMSSYAGKQVTVTGHVFKQEGLSMVEVEKIEKAASSEVAPSKNPAASKIAHKAYICSMDGYTSEKPGKCPKCGMDLEEKK